MIMLTDDERILLHRLSGTIGQVIATPKHGVDSLRQSQGGGGGKGFNYRMTKTGLEAEWCNYDVVERLPDGSPGILRFHKPHLHVEITYTRLRQWASSLPAELCARALTAWRTYPVDTRDLAELDRIVHEAIDLSAPAEQLELFEVA
jgi:hypothetical protein